MKTNPKSQEPVDGSPCGERRRIADLVPLHGMIAVATAARGCEPSHEQLVNELKAGRQPYPVVISDAGVVLFGEAMFKAAKSLGRDDVEVVVCPDCDGLDEGDLLLKAAGLCYRAA